MEILNKKQKIILIVIVIFILLFIGYYIIKKASNSEYINLETEEESAEENTNETETSENEEIIEEIKYIVVHVTGAVNEEGIVEVEEGSRISDVVEAAGGITEDADLSKINLAYMVQDGQKIYVPSVNDKEEITNITDDAGENVIKSDDSSTKGEKININTASQTELETLNGIGPSTALKIINYRNENGAFKNIEDIKNVPGIGDAKFENIKESISVK